MGKFGSEGVSHARFYGDPLSTLMDINVRDVFLVFAVKGRGLAGSRSVRAGRDPQKRTLAKGELRGSIRRCERSCMPGTYTQAPTSAKGAKGAAFPLDPGWQKIGWGGGLYRTMVVLLAMGYLVTSSPLLRRKSQRTQRESECCQGNWPCARCPPSRGEFFCYIFFEKPANTRVCAANLTFFGISQPYFCAPTINRSTHLSTLGSGHHNGRIFPPIPVLIRA